MVNENLIHVKIDNPEARSSKKEILSLEFYSLNLAKEIEEYKRLRKKELDKKTEMLRLIKKLNANLNKIKRLMPKVNYLEKSSHEKKESFFINSKSALNKKDSIEIQIENIQNRINALQGRF
jgi:hypothetical protein